MAEGRGAFCRKPSPPPPPAAAAAANIDDGALAGGFRQQIPHHSEGYSLLRFNASHVGVPVVERGGCTRNYFQQLLILDILGTSREFSLGDLYVYWLELLCGQRY